MPGGTPRRVFCCGIFVRHQVVSNFSETNPRCENATMGRSGTAVHVTAQPRRPDDVLYLPSI